jgi:hypothetical protein
MWHFAHLRHDGGIIWDPLCPPFIGWISTTLSFEGDGLQVEQSGQKINIDWLELQEGKQDV